MRNKINNETEKEVFKGKIAISDIKSIQKYQINYVTSTLLILSLVGIIVGAIALATLDMSMGVY